jgi:hypothetical protein
MLPSFIVGPLHQPSPKNYPKVLKNSRWGSVAIAFLLTTLAGSLTLEATQIYFHDFGTTAITVKPYTVAPTLLAPNLSSSSWTTSAKDFAGYPRPSGSTNHTISLSNSIGTPAFTLTFEVASGYYLNLTGLSFWRQRSRTGAQNLSITVNGGSAVYTGTVPETGANVGSHMVTGKNGLTGTITVVITLSGATDNGTFRLDDFALDGEVAAIPIIISPPITLQLVGKGTASFDGTNTSITHGFLGISNQTYQIEYSTDLVDWTSSGAIPTGVTGSFPVTFTSPGNHASGWNRRMFFRAKR